MLAEVGVLVAVGQKGNLEQEMEYGSHQSVENVKKHCGRNLWTTC